MTGSNGHPQDTCNEMSQLIPTELIYVIYSFRIFHAPFPRLLYLAGGYHLVSSIDALTKIYFHSRLLQPLLILVQ